MTWRDLLHDLENEMAALEAADLAGEVADRTRGEVAAVTLADRCAAHQGGTVVVAVSDETVRGVLRGIGADWLLVVGADGREVLVPLWGVVSIGGLGVRASVPSATGAVATRTKLTVMLRRLARDRACLLLGLADGARVGATLARVAADHVDLRPVDGVPQAAGGAPGQAMDGRNATVTTLTVPLAALRTVRRLEVG